MDAHFSFTITQKEKHTDARTGKLITPHGTIQTPNFIPVATQGSIKALSPHDLLEINVDAILANTYHLYLRPGDKLVRDFGGIGKFMNWDRPTMTDSGGFQVFSLGVAMEHGVGKLLRETDETKPRPRLNRITEEGVTFQSHLDGSTHLLSPEKSMEIQENLGADLIVGFDDLESPKYGYDETRKSLDLTNRWLTRSKEAHKNPKQLLYGVTHGGRFENLRTESAKFVEKYFDAVALGGAHTNKNNMYDVVDWTIQNVTPEKPKHMLGIGEIDDIFNIVERGIDTFDCVIPTRLARMGWAFLYPPEGNPENRFRYDLSKSGFANSKLSVANNCSCMVCQNYTRGYINHLFRARELLSYRLLTYHNIYFYMKLMEEIRHAISENRFHELKKIWLS